MQDRPLCDDWLRKYSLGQGLLVAAAVTIAAVNLSLKYLVNGDATRPYSVRPHSMLTCIA